MKVHIVSDIKLLDHFHNIRNFYLTQDDLLVTQINLTVPQTTPYTITITPHYNQNACDILDFIIKAAAGKPIKLLTTCCFG
jgi:hypothetical protein